MHDEDKITYFAETDARNKRVAFGIKAKDRLKHVYVVGKTGMGKSTLLENMAVQDIQNGEGMCFIDPHGKTADLLLEYVPKERLKDVIWFAPFDSEYPISFNVMEDVGPDKRHLVVSGLMSAFKKIWGPDTWSARMEYILGNTLLALLEYPDSTLLGVNKMYTDKEYRKKVVDNVTDPSVKAFWVEEFAKYTDRFAAEATPAIQNKIGQFISNPIVRNVIGQPKSSFDIRKAMDEKKILIVNLSKGLVGETNANLLGSMLITKLYLGAMSRADTPERELKKLPNFYLYVDEFQSFANESFANILSEARKYKLNLTIAHQYIEQMSEEVRAAVIGNVGTMIVFRVGAYDAVVLEKEFSPTFMAPDLVNLGIYQIYLKLMIDGVTSKPFSASTLPPIKKQEENHMLEIRDNSRKVFAQPKAIVEETIRALQGYQAPKAAALDDGSHDTPVKERHDERPPREKPERREEKRQERKPVPPAEEQRKNPFQGIKFETDETGSVKLVQEGDEKAAVTQGELADKARTAPAAQPKKNGKEPTKENVQALRDVLSAVLKKPQEAPSKPLEQARDESSKEGEKEEPKRSGPQQKASPEPEPAKEKARPRQFDSGGETAKEVPEEVLKQVLSMEESR